MSVTVATLLRRDGGPSIECPAAVLVAGDLARRGHRARLDPIDLDAVDAGALGAFVFFPGAGGALGLGVQAGDPAGGRAGAAVVADWLAVTGPRDVLLAAPRSFCAGVERAIDIVDLALRHRPAPVYVRKQIVHNTHVVTELRERGAVFVDELDDVPEGATVVFSAHGVSPAVRGEATRRGLSVIDATCPLVAKVHAEARRSAARGDTIVLIGHAGHEEVEGTLGEAPDRTVLVQSPADVDLLDPPDPARVSYLAQTTLGVDETAAVVDRLRARFPAAHGSADEDICYATTNRQEALDAIAADADVVLVVGSENSSNSCRLVELAQRRGTPAHLIDAVADIRSEWLAAARVVGLTAGASAPPRLVDDVIAALAGLGPLTVTERRTAEETIQFTLPATVAPSRGHQ
jgi:4-hydroxy-3-methylbut-2-enyl diphosphate reductase